MNKTILTILTCAIWGFATGAGAAVIDHFNNVGGAADLTWTGDTTGFSVEATTGSMNEGTGAFRTTSTGAAANSFVTDITAELALDTVYTFSGYIGADTTRAVNFANYAALVLMSDTSDAAAITAGTMNGYRLGIFAGDQVELQKASGAGWVTLQAGPSSGLALQDGWNVSATIDSATGNYSWGYVTGNYTDTIAEDNSGTDTAFVDPAGTTYGGFTYVVSTADTYYVDAYNMAAIPEPATLSLILGSGAGLLWIRRKFTI
ncbi:hypothetical protein PDESU_01141 [Pontiella desulfatans]|uniref:PEP-CTERM protein-sorting domain-containing protein n=1 Tax=Pontiella desulfatans TaxID=2750659 RepID=A0A6C2TXY3_PONDE|nr:PEP-CTERM sorting domain-containing protein [Pontiella desulfatans]VGO12588.1 hypothetical protein PDESU_01141 [Pontiella desulfatans]